MKTLGLAVLCLAGFAAPAAPAPLFEENFEQAPAGKPSTNFMVVDGGFAVREDHGARFLELPGHPLENYGILFGPPASSNVCVEARLWGESTGRRHPLFAVGLGGIGGLKLWVAPGREQLELHLGERLLVAQPLRWKSGVWTQLKLRCVATPQGWRAEGKLWLEGEQEPPEWSVGADLPQPPPAGRASVWGAPVSGKPIRFDDLRVTEVRLP
ncbi:MAG: hypothetical protein N3J91_06760 [Verrucomicrobiae bacterium]|nr:hypothetical protein [Verrucomicrobiae bacterium]